MIEMGRSPASKLSSQELVAPRGEWGYMVGGEERTVDAFAWQLARSVTGAGVRVIRSRRCLTRKELFHELAAALQFPYYFGDNWDAVDECLNDLEWLQAEAYVLFITNSDALLESEPLEELIMLRRVLTKTAEEWSN